MTLAALVAAGPLRMGAFGPAVQSIQLALKARGYPLTGTGYFGPQTDTAVEDCQRKAGLPPTGIVDAATAALLDQPVATAKAAPAPLWLAVSLSHLGLKEGAGNIDNRELVADIQTVAKDYQHDATPWCAGWVSYCLAKAGEKPSSQPLWALSYADTRNQPVVRLGGPAVGAIAVKTRNGGGHVTFVAGRTRGGALVCCGGNQNDEVNNSPYSPDVFVGFFWPKGAALPAVTAIDTLPIVNAAGKPVSSET
ncbi:TIGR02594 family protein [Bradyrhizobium xenonodulans]|uniref:TIGR02594 family protein n=1 Tax=Bradyrhizobium xenonodulans TaxID=2736875 RepID=A0ABY7MBD5_9BRAD|nr:TIGR02594 family protein [Bradyrhizobium xenonodulans]WBL75590.1 TIGR02594 family protein [Bradyrhizobium xenonodulans]